MGKKKRNLIPLTIGVNFIQNESVRLTFKKPVYVWGANGCLLPGIGNTSLGIQLIGSFGGGRPAYVFNTTMSGANWLILTLTVGQQTLFNGQFQLFFRSPIICQTAIINTNFFGVTARTLMTFTLFYEA